jgi:hypothetical protein
MLLFSVKKGSISPAVIGAVGMPDDMKFAIYLNILAVIVLAEPAERFSDTASQEEPKAFGVDSIVQLDDSDSEDDGNNSEEPFL